MKKQITLFLFLLFTTLSLFSQSYLGWANKQVNLREGPGKEFAILKTLQQGQQLFIVSTESESDFLNVIDIKTNTEGYVHRSFIKLGEAVKINEKGFFTPSGESTTSDPEIEIYNNTKLNMTLKLNNDNYYFEPQEKRKITLSPGDYNYRASAPGVIPSIGKEIMESNVGYTWQFYIVTERRRY
jgi:hypothetical protein